MRLVSLIAVAAGAMLLATSCAKAPPRTGAREAGIRTGQAAALEGLISRYAERTKTIKALAWLDLSDGEEERQTEAALVIARPASLRANAMDALADVWAQAGSDGSRLWLFLPARDKLYAGRASRSNLRRLLPFNWEVRDAVSVIAGAPPVESGAEFVQVGHRRDNHFVVRDGDLHVWTEGRSGLPAKCARYRDGGATLEYLATFGEYRLVDGIDVPHRIEAMIPERGARIVVVYREVALGAPVDRQVFLAPTRTKGKTVELKD